MINLTVEATQVEIKGAAYAVESIPSGEFGVSAVRLTKLINGESYDLIRANDNRLECSCPDFICRHADKGTCCKHLSYAVANGLLPVAPVAKPVEVKATVAPITRKDLARASYFGIKLPVVEVVPVVIEVVPVVESPAPVASVTPVASVMVGTVPAIEVIAPIVEATAVDLAPVKPSRHDEIDEAFVLGWELGHSGKNAMAPKGWSFPRLVAFYEGLEAGQAALHDQTQAADLEWLASLQANHPHQFDDLHATCLAEAGCSTGFASC